MTHIYKNINLLLTSSILIDIIVLLFDWSTFILVSSIGGILFNLANIILSIRLGNSRRNRLFDNPKLSLVQIGHMLFKWGTIFTGTYLITNDKLDGYSLVGVQIVQNYIYACLSGYVFYRSIWNRKLSRNMV